MEVEQNSFTKAKRRIETLKETADCTSPSKRKGTGPDEIINEKDNLKKKIKLEFNPRNKYLESLILAHHVAETYPPHLYYSLRYGLTGEELFC